MGSQTSIRARLAELIGEVAREMRSHVDGLRLSTGCPDLTPKQSAWADRLEAIALLASSEVGVLPQPSVMKEIIIEWLGGAYDPDALRGEHNPDYWSSLEVDKLVAKLVGGLLPAPAECAICKKPQPCAEHGRTPITSSDFKELRGDVLEGTPIEIRVRNAQTGECFNVLLDGVRRWIPSGAYEFEPLASFPAQAQRGCGDAGHPLTCNCYPPDAKEKGPQ